jgi:hypothetical protein
MELKRETEFRQLREIRKILAGRVILAIRANLTLLWLRDSNT